MSKFSDFIDGLQDAAGTLAKKELKDLLKTAKADSVAFIRLQAENLERWTLLLADGDLTPAGYKKLVRKMEVLTQLHKIKMSVAAKSRAQRLAKGIKDLVIDGLFSLI